ncbi:MAG: methenyltetrahydrofolate cyclohydrolase [Methylococcaceae bacterium NSP1-2]|nr:cyclodeaminase/cyclohydrolase family protein [Methylococcaceae bacterium]OYV15960.1 MAG: methenyltetrahydrofolate cyclohydrolase [Methylococcaceae bacterium NSP1-2]
MSEIKDQPIQQFLDELASKSATPGGGSAAAIMGAQGAALISMVCNLTIGKPKFAEVESEMQALLAQAEDLRAQLTDFIQADVDVFNRVMAAYGLPKETDKAARSSAIQTVMKDATIVPLECAKACAKTITLSQIAAEKGNPNVISDAGAAVMAAYGGLKTAALNVYINAGSLKDRDFAEAKIAELAAIMQDAETTTEAIYQVIKAKL